MTTPKHANDDGENGRYYTDPATGDLLISVTNTLQQLAKPALAPAAATETVKYMMANLDQAVEAAQDPFEKAAFETAARRAYRDAWDSKANLGTRVHHLAESHVLGRPAAPDPDAEPFVDQYKKFLGEAGIDILDDIEAAEVTVLNRTLGYAGTADLWVWLRRPPAQWGMQPGLWLIDAKTSLTKLPSVVYAEYPLQLAALRYAEVALDAVDGEHPVPEFAGAAVLNLRADRYGIVPLPAGREAFEAFTHIAATARYIHTLDLKPYKPVNDWKKKPGKKTTEKVAA
ncbi:hypothetical protein [Streptomonospora nanhaiensis]|uniref:hypothetical protein n=1 Tax=Streptomonospora nanhaiensis TaxID=1323731 RepID=UPI001C382C43|nr:hypothetical protein [Streptomonospora nanhaiensis]MBV2366944.1 hypothetical protein [Streptomonospora nanhaiensis]